jgi:5-methylcytosine-specific restriction endonuclease McrA
MSPYLPKPATRPWLLSKEKSKKHQGRTARTHLYDTYQWKKVRKLQLQRESLCRTCLSASRIVAASVADHVIRYNTKEGQELGFFNMDNLQSLCSSCHARKSNRERFDK